MASSTGSRNCSLILAAATHHLPLRDRIHSVDVIHPFGPVPVSLMHRVDAQKPGSPRGSGLRRSAIETALGRVGFELRRHVCRYCRAAPQVVQMRHRDPRQPHKFCLAELLLLALQDAPRGRPAQALVRAIHFRQQHDIGLAVLRAESAAAG